MEAKTAVRVAKEYILDLFAEEEIMNLGLEEVQFDELSNSWSITLGFSRPWNQKNAPTSALGARQTDRTYKVINLSDANGEVLSLKDRILESSQAV